jgi:hypothetical protein
MVFDQAAIGFQGSLEASDGVDEPMRAARNQATQSPSQFRISRKLCPACRIALRKMLPSEFVASPKMLPVKAHAA